MVLSFKPDLVQISPGSDYKGVTTVVIYTALNKVIHQREKGLHNKDEGRELIRGMTEKWTLKCS